MRKRGQQRKAASRADDRLRDAYLTLLLKTIVGTIYRDPPLRSPAYDDGMRDRGLDWPSRAHSMIGIQRMQNLRDVVESVLRDGVPGDLIETGVWRGGACIFMRGIFFAHGVTDRRVWVADSFEGLPAPDKERYPADEGDKFHSYEELAVGLDEVRDNFARYGLLDQQVVFLKGWFRDTLKSAPIERLAVLRLDGDMYESTMEALDALYVRLSPAGFVIVDDYHVVPGCKQAVDDFRAAHGVHETLREIDGTGVFWQRSAS